nr:MAG TPA: hypothetical protein [Caudoviricetes sp.]
MTAEEERGQKPDKLNIITYDEDTHYENKETYHELTLIWD